MYFIPIALNNFFSNFILYLMKSNAILKKISKLKNKYVNAKFPTKIILEFSSPPPPPTSPKITHGRNRELTHVDGNKDGDGNQHNESIKINK